MTKVNAEKLDTLFFIIQNTAGLWEPEQIMEMYYMVEVELNPFEEERVNPLTIVNKDTH
jgi:hypothetical protein